MKYFEMIRSRLNREDKINIKKIYTPLAEARKELLRRHGDQALKQKIEKFFEGDIPKAFLGSPKAVLSRYIITPNREFFHFLELVEKIDLDYICLEYSHDKFVARNLDKYNLCKLYVQNTDFTKKAQSVEAMRVVDFNKTEGKMLDKIRTVWGDKLIDFHHELLTETVKGSEQKVFNISKWFDEKRKKDKQFYYLYYLALFVCHGVLFENFLLNKEEKEFTEKKVLPSFWQVEKIFGVKPLIVPLEPLRNEDDSSWRYYSKDTRMFLSKKNKTKI